MEGDRGVERHLPARLTPREGRRFGLTVGLAFLVLAGISRWRGHDLSPLVLAGLGGALTVAGLAIPGYLGPVFRGWMTLGQLISKVTTPIFMGLLYFVAITPMGVVLRALGHKPLEAPDTKGSYWVKHESSSNRSMTRQY